MTFNEFYGIIIVEHLLKAIFAESEWNNYVSEVFKMSTTPENPVPPTMDEEKKGSWLSLLLNKQRTTVVRPDAAPSEPPRLKIPFCLCAVKRIRSLPENSTPSEIRKNLDLFGVYELVLGSFLLFIFCIFFMSDKTAEGEVTAMPYLSFAVGTIITMVHTKFRAGREAALLSYAPHEFLVVFPYDQNVFPDEALLHRRLFSARAHSARWKFIFVLFHVMAFAFALFNVAVAEKYIDSNINVETLSFMVVIVMLGYFWWAMMSMVADGICLFLAKARFTDEQLIALLSREHEK